MKLPRIVAPMTMVSILMIATSCRTPQDGHPDAVTGASPKYKPSKMMLPPESTSYKVVGALDGLKNYVVEYDDTLYRGGEPFADSAVQSLAKYGIRTVVSITPTEEERKLCREHGFTLVEIPFEKTNGLSPTDLKLYIDTIKTAEGPFYIHCHGGTHRGGVLGVAYRVHIQGWPQDKALVEYGRLGGDLLTDHAMLESVRTLQR